MEKILAAPCSRSQIPNPSLLFTASQPPLTESMASIEDVTASFAASLALAGSDVVDISHLNDGGNRSNSQAFLLAKPLTKKKYEAVDLQRHFRRIWVLDGGFKVQASGHGRFVFTFDLKRDRNKVIRGGPWYFSRSPVLLQQYDGLADPLEISMNHLFFWVKISGIPPALEDRKTIMNVASIAGKYLDFDQKLFDHKGLIRVRVAHAISQPFFLKRMLKLILGVVKEITYFFENLHGKCRDCNLIIHEQDECPLGAAPKLQNNIEAQVAIGTSLASHFPGLSDLRFQNGTFHFHGVQAPILPSIARNLFGAPSAHKPRRPIVIRNEDVRPKAAHTVLALPHAETDQATVKRGRPSSPFTSPKKLKTPFGESNQATSPSMLQKKLKLPEFHTKFSAKSLGLIEALGGILIPNEGVIKQEDMQPIKKKKGRPLGLKNKNLSKSKKVSAEDVLSAICPSKPPSPSVKGKEKI